MPLPTDAHITASSVFTHPLPFLSKRSEYLETDWLWWGAASSRTQPTGSGRLNGPAAEAAPMMAMMTTTMHPSLEWQRGRIKNSTGHCRRRRSMVSCRRSNWLSLYALRMSCTFQFRYFSCSHIMCSLLTPVPKDNEMSGDDGTALMRPVSVRDGDTVGVAVQQSDLPMIQFLLNGEPLHEIAINRFRGSVFPAIYVREGIKAEVVFDEDNFKELSPHARFGPLIAARGII